MEVNGYTIKSYDYWDEARTSDEVDALWDQVCAAEDRLDDALAALDALKDTPAEE